MRHWVAARLAQSDHVYLNAAGYRRLAAAMFRDLMEAQAAFSAKRTPPPAEESHGEKSQNH